MAAAPQSGTFIAYGVKSGNTYAVDAYFSDVAAAPVRFDGGAGSGATSPDFYTFPEACIVRDMSVVTGLTDTTKIRIVANGAPTNIILRYAVHLTTIATRPTLNIGFKAGSRMAAIQQA
jgi:hypothetical protein